MIRKILFGWMLLVAGLLHAAVPPGTSGSWFNPAQPGHGLSIQILDDGRAIAYWFTYDRAGNPLHLYVDGVLDGTAIRGAAYAASGMPFGTFDPSTLRVDPWGQIAIEFASCNSGRLTYAADTPFGSGEFPIVRLSSIRGLGCDDRELAPLPVGLYSGSYRARSNGVNEVTYGLVGVVDPDGKLWALQENVSPPGPRWVGAFVPPVITTSRRPIFGHAGVTIDADVSRAAGLSTSVRFKAPTPLLVNFDENGVGTAMANPAVAPDLQDATLAFDANATGRITGRLNIAHLMGGAFHAITLSQIIHTPLEIVFTANSRVCFRFPTIDPTACAFEGPIRIRSATHRFFDFEVTAASNKVVYRGRGWAETERGVVSRVSFAGIGDSVGFGISAVRQ